MNFVGKAEELEQHVEREHLVPLVWWVGDGPKNTGMLEKEDGLPGYLFDREGNQGTPSVRDQEVETEEERKARLRRLRKVLMERERNAPWEDMEGMVVDVGMDVSG